MKTAGWAPRLWELACHVVLLGLAFGTFANSLHGQFVFDDIPAVWMNKDLRPSTPWADIWRHDFWGNDVGTWQSHKSYRPLTVATFRFSYWLAGEDFETATRATHNAFTWHLFNVIAHCIATLLGLHLFRCLGGPDGVAFAAAALFATHPIHTDAVSSVVSRGEILSAIMFLLSLLCYIHLVSGNTARLMLPGGFSSEGVRHAIFLPMSAGLGLAGMLCKEQSITVVVVKVAYDMTHGSGALRDAYSAVTKRAESQGRGGNDSSIQTMGGTKAAGQVPGADKVCNGDPEKRQRSCGGRDAERLGFFCARMVFLLVAYLSIYRWRMAKNGACDVVYKDGDPNTSPLDYAGPEAPGIHSLASCRPIFQRAENPARRLRGPGSDLTKLMTWSYLVPLNAWLLVAPAKLRADYSEGTIELVTRPDDPRNFVTVAFFCLLLFSIVYFLRLSLGLSLGAKEGQDCPILGLSLLVAPFVPSSNLFFPVGFVVAERTLYIPSLGFCVLLALLVFSLLPGRAPHATASIVAAYAARAVVRNRDWSTGERFYQALERDNPKSPKAQHGLGSCYAGGQGCQFDPCKVEMSLRHLHEALRLEPSYFLSSLDIGHHFTRTGDYATAQSYYRRAMEVMPEEWEVVNFLGSSYLAGEDYSRAAEVYNHGIKVWPGRPVMYSNFAKALLGSGNFHEAFDALMAYFLMGPCKAQVYRQYGHALALVGQHQTAENMLRHSLRLDPRDPEALHALGDVLVKGSRTGEAALYFARSFLIDHRHMWQERIPKYRRRSLGGIPLSHDSSMRAIGLLSYETDAQKVCAHSLFQSARDEIGENIQAKSAQDTHGSEHPAAPVSLKVVRTSLPSRGLPAWSRT